MTRSHVSILIAGLVILVLTLPVNQNSTIFAQSNQAQKGGAQNSLTENDGLLVLNEISPWPSDGNVFVEILNPGDEAVVLDGWTVEFISGYSYTFPRGSGEIAAGGLHLLNIPVENPLNPDGDGCTLGNRGGTVDAVTWGQPSGTEGISMNVGSPVNPQYGFLGANRSLNQPDDVLIRLPIAWETDMSSLTGSAHWVYRGGDAATPGEQNPPPPPVLFSPSDGALIASDFMLTVEGFDWPTETTFQVATDELFENIVLEETVEEFALVIEDLEAGTYFWRVRGFRDEFGPWTQYKEFTQAPFDMEELIEQYENGARTGSIAQNEKIRLAQRKGGGPDPEAWLTSYYAIPIVQDTQRKDSMMVCLDGCNMAGTYPWDNPQPINDDSNASHGCGNCGMASLKMMASAHGRSLSQDRIAYHMMEEAGTASYHAVLKGQIGNPWQDLNHSPGGGLYSQDCPMMVSWLYGQPAGASTEVFYNANTFFNNSPAMDSIAEFIADNRPVLRHMSTHTTLIGGVGVITIPGIGEWNFVQVYDTNLMGNVKWIDIDSTSAVFNEFTFPPTTGRMTRNDEAELWQDSDGDGLVDFDETQRFQTDPNDEDTDGDGVKDKQDMLGYLFMPTGDYLKGERDFDNDGFAKELDPDNDDPNDTSANDGCEDIDKDGFLTPESRETTCFNVNDDFDNVNPDCFRGYIRMDVGADAVGPDYRLHHKYYEMVIIQAGEIDPDAFSHEHKWDYTFEYFYPDGQSTAYNNDHGDARVKLEYDPATMEYYLMVESNTPSINIQVDSTFQAMQWMTIPPPSIYWFDRDERWPLGPAQEVNGGLLVKGEWVVDPHVFTWEIWVEPPTS